MRNQRGFILLEILVGLTISLVVAKATAKFLSFLSESSTHFAIPQQLDRVENNLPQCTIVSSEEPTLLCSKGALRWYLLS